MEPGKLSPRATSLIRASKGATLVSAISAFEIALKARKGKLELGMSPEDWWQLAVQHHGLREVAITAEIVMRSVALPAHHNDPADRIVLATAEKLNCPVATADPLFRAYSSVPIEW